MATDPAPLRDVFDSAADAYDRARPGYPEQLVDDLVDLAGIHAGTRVLEIGPGTGQLSLALAPRGVRLVAVERGANLASVARRNLQQFPNAEVVTADFYKWDALEASFDAVVAATSFHWLPESTRISRSAAILRAGGSLAVIQSRWGVAVGDDPFFSASQACYAKWNPDYDPEFRQTRPEEVPDLRAELTNDFGNATQKRYFCRREYDASGYCDLLGTFSYVLALEPGRRASLLACIAALIDSRFGGHVVRHDMYDLFVARRVG